MSIPAGASDVAFFEADAWEEDSLYVPFAATPAGLTGFPARLGTNGARLRDGPVADAVPACLRSRVSRPTGVADRVSTPCST